MDAELERHLQKGWDSTCKIVFGQELGKVEDFRPWFSKYLPKTARRKSCLSGKEVLLAADNYPKQARFLSSEELAFNKDYSLSINQVKDIDSLLAALAEKCEYTGNKCLGTSANVSQSDLILDSQQIWNSTNIESSMCCDSSFMMRKGSKYCFGAGWSAMTEFTMRSVALLNIKRCVEVHWSAHGSDCYFSFNCFGCHDLMFSFGQRNKGHMIGNLALPKEKYAALKKKLVGEIAGELAAKRTFPSLLELMPNAMPSPLPKISPAPDKDIKDMGKIDKDFASTYKVIFKRAPAAGIKGFQEWLERGTIAAVKATSIFGTVTCYPDNMPLYSNLPEKRLVSSRESIELAKLGMANEDVQSLAAVVKGLGKVAYVTAEIWEGECSNVNGTPLAFNTHNTYRGYESTYSEHTGCNSLALHSKYAYGCGRIIESEFCIKCSNSQYLVRCLEMDSCDKCADSYFCHNCEGLSDCMFCFNMKGARYCIGNTQLSKEEYLKARDLLLKKMADELDKTRRLEMSIYSIGALKK
ncbi:MAG: hypothetical protein NT051_02970 [Candidatus Micrarchaeota archaeon]|nr:hypothetical protein [Candidatus Micrarchaeota archaeon]